MSDRLAASLQVASAAERMAWFHAEHAGVTRRALARGRDERGRSSYQLLAELAPARGRALDLGCGDGSLLEVLRDRGVAAIGVDRAGAELALARRAQLQVVRATAAALPFAAASFGCVLSHLAFSVMDDVEAIVAEVERVLAPGGSFAAIVGGGPVVRALPESDDIAGQDADVFEDFLGLLSQRLLGRQRCRFGEARAGRLEGWRALWGPRGFAVSCTRHVIDLSGDFAQVWITLASAYDCMLLSDAERSALQREFTARCAKRFAAQIPLHMVVWRLAASRA